MSKKKKTEAEISEAENVRKSQNGYGYFNRIDEAYARICDEKEARDRHNEALRNRPFSETMESWKHFV